MNRSRPIRSRGDGIRVSFRVYPRTHGELHAELQDLPPGERGPRLLFLAQLGVLARTSIGYRRSMPVHVGAGRAGLPQVGDDFRCAIAELDLAGFTIS